MFFADGSYQVSENDGSVSVCVEREGDAAETFSVDVATSERDPVQAEGIRLVSVIPWVLMLQLLCLITLSWQ